MRDIVQNIIRYRPVRGITSRVVLVLAVFMTGCMGEGVYVLPAQSESSSEKAEDHMAAALLYHQGSQRLEAEAQRYQLKVTGIRPEEDPKGIRRAGLLTATRANQQHAAEMQTLSAMHYERAQTMKAQQGKE